MKIMTIEDENFTEFCKELSDMVTNVGCNTTLVGAEVILSENYSEYDLHKTLEYFRKNGGYCDCEILMNVNKSMDN